MRKRFFRYASIVGVYCCVLVCLLLNVGLGQSSDEQLKDTMLSVGKGEIRDSRWVSVDPDDVIITIACSLDELREEAILSTLGQYTKEHPHIVIQFLDTPKSIIRHRLSQNFQAGNSDIDIYFIHTSLVGSLADYFIDLNTYGAAKVTQEHFPAIIKNSTVNGKLVGIPWSVDTGLLYYRKDLLLECGYEYPPTTWDQLEEIARTIQTRNRPHNSDFWGFVWQGNAYESLTYNALEWIYSHGGGSIIEPDGSISINNAYAVEALERASDWIGEISPPEITSFTEKEAFKMWQAGNAAFMRNWPYAYKLGNADDSPMKGKIGVTALPRKRQSAATLTGWQLAVSTNSKNHDTAAKVVFFLASETVQKARVLSHPWSPISSVMSLYRDPDVIKRFPFFRDLEDALLHAAAFPSSGTKEMYTEVSDRFYSAVHSVLTRTKSAQEAVEELERDFENLLY